MTTIKQADLIQSIADALQFISYYHPLDYIQAVGRAYEREQSPAAKDALAQILTNSRMCAEGHRPICQDTGHRRGLPQGRHERALRRRHGAERHDQRGRAARLPAPGQQAARLGGRPADRRAQEHQGQHPGGHLYRYRARRPTRDRAGGQGRWLREQVQVHHPQPERQPGRLGA